MARGTYRAAVRITAICIDCHDPRAVAGFWATALGGTVRERPGGAWSVALADHPELWALPVPEPKVVKNRVHLDLWVRSPDDLVALGATFLADHGEGFVVLADPEGNELCAFPADGSPGDAPARLLALCVDSDRPEELAAWWADRLGADVGPGPDGTPRWLHGAAGLGDALLKFVRVHDERVVKNRWHWDVDTPTVDALVAAGATIVRRPDDDISWTVLADPDGNVVCAFEPAPETETETETEGR